MPRKKPLPAKGAPAPPEKGRAKPGPKPIRLTDDQKRQIVEHIRHGLARALAVSEAGVAHYRTFLRELDLDAEFAEAVDTASKVEHATLETIVRAAADSNASLGLQLLQYRQKGAMLNAARREAALRRKDRLDPARHAGQLGEILGRLVDLILPYIDEARRPDFLLDLDKFIAFGAAP